MDDLDTLTADQAAAALKLDRKSFDRLVKEGSFPPGFYLPHAAGLRWYGLDARAYLWLQMRHAAKPPPKKVVKKRGTQEIPGASSTGTDRTGQD